MEINTTGTVRSFAARVFRPWVVAFVLVATFFGLTAWQVSETWFDHQLPNSAIQAKQLRVNTAQLNKLTKDLRSYHNPTAPPAVNTDIFNPLPKS